MFSHRKQSHFAAILVGFLVVGFASGSAVAQQPGTLDASFDAGIGTDQWVSSVAVQSDGMVVVGGYFSEVNRQSRNNIARLNRHGALDSSFDPGSGANDLVNVVALQTNRIIIAGYFTQFNGTNQGYVARLNADGGLDTTFISVNAGADGPVLALAVQNDGKVLIGGRFTSVNGVGRTNLARLNADGGLDKGFSPGPVASGSLIPVVNSVAVQTDGKVLIGGTFTHVNGTPRNNLARLNSDGSLDSGFNPTVDLTGATVLAGVSALDVSGEGKIFVAGDFTALNGMPRTNIARLNSSGAVDTNLNPGSGPDAPISSLAVQSNGQVIVGGYFGRVNGVARPNIARLNIDGGVDAGFEPGPGADDAVFATVLQPDGNVLIGGLFTSFGGTSRHGLARLYGDAIISAPLLLNPVLSNNVFRVSFASVTGKSYILEFKNALADSTWTGLPAVAGDGAVKTLLDPSATAPGRLYRVRVQ